MGVGWENKMFQGTFVSAWPSVLIEMSILFFRRLIKSCYIFQPIPGVPPEPVFVNLASELTLPETHNITSAIQFVAGVGAQRGIKPTSTRALRSHTHQVKLSRS